MASDVILYQILIVLSLGLGPGFLSSSFGVFTLLVLLKIDAD
jgi:hypothetical protein